MSQGAAAQIGRFVVLGGERVATESRFAAAASRFGLGALPPSYVDLMLHFGPGTFNGTVHLQPPQQLQTFDERVARFTANFALTREQIEPLSRYLLFASTDNGDELAWHLDEAATGEPHVYLFPSRSYNGAPVAPSAVAFVDLIIDNDPRFPMTVRPYFMRARPRHRRTASLLGGALPATAALDELVAGLWRDGVATLLGASPPEGREWLARTLAIPAADTLVHVQMVGYGDSGSSWTVMVDSPVGPLDARVGSLWPRLGGLGIDGVKLSSAVATAQVRITGQDLSR